MNFLVFITKIESAAFGFVRAAYNYFHTRLHIRHIEGKEILKPSKKDISSGYFLISPEQKTNNCAVFVFTESLNTGKGR